MLTSQANHPWNWAPHFGAEWMDAQGKSVLAQDPAGQEMYRWQQELVDFYGWDGELEAQIDTAKTLGG